MVCAVSVKLPATPAQLLLNGLLTWLPSTLSVPCPHFHTTGPAVTCSVLVERPAALSQLLESLVQCMTFEPGAAMQLLHSK